MNVVTVDASRRRFARQHFADILCDVPIAGIHASQRRIAQIDLEVAKQVIARDEIRRIGQARLFRFAGAQMALRSWRVARAADPHFLYRR